MSERDPLRPFQATPAELVRANRLQSRKRSIAAILAHYATPAVVEPPSTVQATEAEVELLRRVVEFNHRGLFRNRYHASRFGASWRSFLAMRDRGLVTVVEDGAFARVMATTQGIAAVRQAMTRGKVA